MMVQPMIQDSERNPGDVTKANLAAVNTANLQQIPKQPP